MAGEIKWALNVPNIGYACCGLILFIGITLIFWMPLNLLIKSCSPQQSKQSKIYMTTDGIEKNGITNGIPEGSPLLYQKSVEMKQMNGITKDEKSNKR
jgi:hypothetical protein